MNEDLLVLADRLSKIGFPTLLVLILWASYRKYWVWGRDVTDMVERHTAEKLLLTEDRNWWRDIAVRATGIAEVQGKVLRVKESKELSATRRADESGR